MIAVHYVNEYTGGITEICNSALCYYTGESPVACVASYLYTHQHMHSFEYIKYCTSIYTVKHHAISY